MTKEELLKRAKEVIEYYTIQGWKHHFRNDYCTYDCNVIRIEDLENNENMLNFLVEFINIMKKYNIGYSGVNGMLCNFKTKDAGNDNVIRFGISNLGYFLSTQEEMDKDLEKAKENAYQKMLNNRVKFLLSDNLKYKLSEDEDKCYKVSDYDNIDCENEDVGEEDLPAKFHAEFTADIETMVELNHIETFTNENDIKKEICEKIANTIYRDTFYQINVKDIVDLINKIQLKEIGIGSSINVRTYSVSIKNVLFEIEEYYDDEPLSSLYELVIKRCVKLNIENDINITNIEFIDPKFNTEE